jgi:[protein-PII] uridylyltransferase
MNTIIEIETEDRLGLLYTISQVFAALRLNIYLAKISTEKGAAIDAFYVTETNFQKIIDADRQQYVADHLREALLRL